jgi:hypothetical protein
MVCQCIELSGWSWRYPVEAKYEFDLHNKSSSVSITIIPTSIKQAIEIFKYPENGFCLSNRWNQLLRRKQIISVIFDGFPLSTL